MKHAKINRDTIVVYKGITLSGYASLNFIRATKELHKNSNKNFCPFFFFISAKQLVILIFFLVSLSFSGLKFFWKTCKLSKPVMVCQMKVKIVLCSVHNTLRLEINQTYLTKEHLYIVRI